MKHVYDLYVLLHLLLPTPRGGRTGRRDPMRRKVSESRCPSSSEQCTLHTVRSCPVRLPVQSCVTKLRSHQSSSRDHLRITKCSSTFLAFAAGLLLIKLKARSQCNAYYKHPLISSPFICAYISRTKGFHRLQCACDTLRCLKRDDIATSIISR